MLPEWAPQSGVAITWPHAETDWKGNLSEVTDCYFQLAVEVLQREKLLIICQDKSEILPRLPADFSDRLTCVELPYNDTWIRDYGPISVMVESANVCLDFRFNGWGNKYMSILDDKVTGKLFNLGVFGSTVRHQRIHNFVLEGGSIETDGRGTLMTTRSCLLSPNRNPGASQEEIENILKEHLGISRVIWIGSGYLSGDDTDGHIDVLARFCNEHVIAYLKCYDELDEHYRALADMENQLRAVKREDGHSYELVPLPLPSPIYDENRNRLPATYCNFLILNDAVLVPMYQCDQDAQALDVFRGIFPGKEIVGINALPLIKQGGSIHCATMQLPQGVL